MAKSPALEEPAVAMVSDSDGEDLSDEQIFQLLKDAELRIKAKSAPPQDQQNPDNPDELSLVNTDHQPKAPTFRIPKLNPGTLPQSYVRSKADVAQANQSRLVDEKDRKLANQSRHVEDPVKVKEHLNEKKKATAGSDWFNMPRTDLTPELKRDLQLLQMRSVIDPKRHYKKSGKKFKAPEYSQVGTVVEGPTEFFSARIPNKERKQTFVDEVLSAKDSVRKYKSKYDSVKASRSSGKKEFYKNLKAKRSGGSKYR
ncbi:MAG: hypothetical protein M4579_003290 [Chaenotheca gracillima]|nr:MAG: hypothetical protein M4579_003290 [Chaenotheca gracillima]